MTNRDILTDPQWVAFQKQLDEQPDSHATRAVLADWLEGQGHPWAKAYRWMAKMRKYAGPVGWYLSQPLPVRISDHCKLPTIREIPTSPIFDFLSRNDAEVRLYELFDALPLVGKEGEL